MILSLFTAYYSKGVIILKKSKIIKNYFYSSFIWDFLSVIPLFLSSLSHDIVGLISMLRLIKMRKIFYELEEHLFISGKIKGFYELFKLMLLIIYVGHFFACSWLFVAKLEIDSGSEYSWIQVFKLFNSSWQDQYISALYFAVYTMVTVGYGDLYPTNIAERGVCIVLMILACGVFAYSLTRFGDILEEMYKQEKEFKYV